MASCLVQSTRVQQATSFALSICSARIYQTRTSIETATMQASLRDMIVFVVAFRLFMSIYQLYQD